MTSKMTPSFKVSAVKELRPDLEAQKKLNPAPAAKKTKTPTYNLTEQQISDIKKQASKEAIEVAWTLMLGLPCMPLLDKFNFTNEELVIDDLAAQPSFAAIGIKVHLSVGSIQLQAVNGFQYIAKGSGAFGIPLDLTIPAVAQLNGQGVFPLLQQLGHIILAEIDPVGQSVVEGIDEFAQVTGFIVRDQGLETVFCYGLSVNFGFKIA